MKDNPLAHDLALKRTVHAPVEQKPIYAWRDVVAIGEISLPPIVLLCPHGEERFDLTEVADTLGKAFTNVCISQGEKEIFTDKNRAWVAQICRELAGNLTELARQQNPLRLTLNGLYELIEKTLVDNNAYMVAKSLLLNRSRKLSVGRESAAQSTIRVIRRNGQIVPWSDHKVEIAVRKTFLSLARDSAPAVGISKAVSDRVQALNQAFMRIEEVQDIVQEELMKAGHFKVAEAYILYRAERAAARANGAADGVIVVPEQREVGQETLVVVKQRNGDTLLWDGTDLRKRIEFARTGLDLCLSSEEIEQELRRAVYDQILQKDLDSTIILNSKTLIEKDADFAKFAGRIQLTYIYEEVLGWDILRDGIGKLKESHQKMFRKYVEHGIAIKRLNPRLLEYDLAKISGALDPSSDLELDFLGVQTLYDRYLIVDKVSKQTKRIETPQFFWMRVAMGLFLDEKEGREGKATGLYDLYKTRRFCSSTPTLFNSGTLHSQLSSCFPGDTPVVTSSGLRSIDGIRIGDHVLTQDGEFHRVLGTRAKPNKKRLVKVSLSAMLCGETWIRPTEDHLLFAIPGGDVACVRQRASGGQSACVEYRGRREQCNVVKNQYATYCERLLETDFLRHAAWIRAGELRKGDFVEMLFPRIERAQVLKPANSIRGLSLIERDGFLYELNRDEQRYDEPTPKTQVKPIRANVSLDSNFLRLVGYFLSEGHCQGSDSIFFTFGRIETDFISDTVDLCERVFGLTPILQKGSGECTCVVLHSKLATQFMLALFGTGFDRKKLPQCIMEAPNEALEELLVGVFRGDGCAVHRTQLSLQLSNRDLILQLFQVALKLGILPIVQKPAMPRLARVQPYILAITPSDAPRFACKVGKGIDLFDFQGDDPKWKNRRFFIEGRAFYRIDEVEYSEFNGNVYDIQVEGNPSFSAAGVCAHNCYLYFVDDSIEGIFQRGIAENAYLSKWAGGLGGSWTSVRGTGAYIGGTNGESQGVIPFLKLHNDQLVAVNQGGKRRGSGCAYLETWHNDIFEFLELRKNTGDDRRRTHDMNTANWIPDLFMKRMEARGTWTLFRANEVPDLHETYGRKFEELYVNYEKLAEEGKIYGQKIEALDLWKKMLSMIFETGHPWITFKDPCNVRSPQDHVGVVHSSNLCSEIVLNTSKDETAVCNLGSVILETHLLPDGSLDHRKLRETIRMAVRALDNVIDINFYPTEAAERSNKRHRPIGLGVMGLANTLYLKGVAFASDAAVEFNDEAMEVIAYYAYEASSDLAAERGAYSSYKGSKWDRGLLPPDTVELLEKERGLPIQVPRGSRMDWSSLRAKIGAQGMRNSNVLAIAPTATISNITNTSPCIEPTYKNLFVKSNLSGEFIVLNPFLVKDLKARGLWDQEMMDSLKYFDGELKDIDRVPEDLKQKYLTAFDIDHKWVIDAAARRQKWIDQSQSVNLWIKTPDLKTLSHMYRHAWRVGLKTTYYLRGLGASNIEKSTVAVKKEMRGAAGETKAETETRDAAALVSTAPFPEAKAASREYSAEEKTACSIEAMRNGGTCEACQ
jgi:ribonucleoside-diphosphate reductase alpha subunit